MSTQEFWWEFDLKMEEHERLQETAPGAAGFSQAAWADARKRHTEKMNGR